ncbi:hypothetical protein GCM10010357_52590 [Streptomyces luteireticuli]|uniref:Glyoxalase-like domain-containing protein n=1 Tax=Streptomyces luteireticuli TaxID=173858 RepID=A0ABN0YZN4_9ACTN
MPSVKQFQVAFDCAEPERVARFWNESCIVMQDIEGNEFCLD